MAQRTEHEWRLGPTISFSMTALREAFLDTVCGARAPDTAIGYSPRPRITLEADMPGSDKNTCSGQEQAGLAHKSELRCCYMLPHAQILARQHQCWSHLLYTHHGCHRASRLVF